MAKNGEITSERVIQRFLRKVHFDHSGCWLWTAGKRGSLNYGGFTLDGRESLAHRVSWRIFRGKVPEGAHVLHRCDIPNCCRPDHLFLGTHSDNMRDMTRKGRSPAGEANGNARLTESMVREIRRQYSSGTHTYKTLGSLFGIPMRTVQGVVTRRKWNHIS